MNKIILIIAIALTSYVGYAQSNFDTLENLDDVSTVVVTKDAFELLKKFPDAKSEGMEYFNTAKGLEELKLYSTSNSSIAAKMDGMVKAAIKAGNLTQLVRVKDNDSNAGVYIKSTSNKDIVSEVLLFVVSKDKKEGPSTTIVSLIGKINVNDLAKITDDYEKKSK